MAGRWATSGVAEREGDLQHSLWIYDVHIDEAERGRGYGKAAMVYAEEEARRRGLNRVGLMVFGGNEVARNLYRSLGYAEIAVFMQATLSSRPDSLSSSARGIHRLTTEARLHRGSPAHRGRFTRAGDPSPHLGSDLSDAGPRPTVGFSP
jgi:Acetyltransferase (GNAT) family